MATEARRRCGFRKVGGLYLVSGALSAPCDRLPHELTICPCCNQGIKQTRGWTWVDAAKLFDGDHAHHADCVDSAFCPACYPSQLEKTGLLWVGESFYPTPADFLEEGAAMGISRRIKAIPRNFELGKTWVLFAHPKAITKKIEAPIEDSGTGLVLTKVPAIFCVFKPTRIEKIITQTMSKDAELMADLEKRGITPVIVPDNDKDHQGSVYDVDAAIDSVVEEASSGVRYSAADDLSDDWLWKN